MVFVKWNITTHDLANKNNFINSWLGFASSFVYEIILICLVIRCDISFHKNHFFRNSTFITKILASFQNLHYLRPCMIGMIGSYLPNKCKNIFFFTECTTNYLSTRETYEEFFPRNFNLPLFVIVLFLSWACRFTWNRSSLLVLKSWATNFNQSD